MEMATTFFVEYNIAHHISIGPSAVQLQGDLHPVTRRFRLMMITIFKNTICSSRANLKINWQKLKPDVFWIKYQSRQVST